jgi:hypothetical protein
MRFADPAPSAQAASIRGHVASGTCLAWWHPHAEMPHPALRICAAAAPCSPAPPSCSPPPTRCRLYMTTKLSNPHYGPEVSGKTQIINYGLTQQGLEAQLLMLAVRHERPDLEEAREGLVAAMGANKALLQSLEDTLLHELSNATGGWRPAAGAGWAAGCAGVGCARIWGRRRPGCCQRAASRCCSAVGWAGLRRACQLQALLPHPSIQRWSCSTAPAHPLPPPAPCPHCLAPPSCNLPHPRQHPGQHGAHRHARVRQGQGGGHSGQAGRQQGNGGANRRGARALHAHSHQVRAWVARAAQPPGQCQHDRARLQQERRAPAACSPLTRSGPARLCLGP